jgi:hypothetical protein
MVPGGTCSELCPVPFRKVGGGGGGGSSTRLQAYKHQASITHQSIINQTSIKHQASSNHQSSINHPSIIKHPSSIKHQASIINHQCCVPVGVWMTSSSWHILCEPAARGGATKAAGPAVAHVELVMVRTRFLGAVVGACLACIFCLSTRPSPVHTAAFSLTTLTLVSAALGSLGRGCWGSHRQLSQEGPTGCVPTLQLSSHRAHVAPTSVLHLCTNRFWWWQDWT